MRLTKSDLNAIEYEVTQIAGPAPSIETLKADGHVESLWLNRALELIRGGGRVVTLLTAELIQSGAALTICVVFAILEYWRVWHGALALGQSQEQSSLIAFAVVTANVVHPVYALRDARSHTEKTITRQSLRGYLASVYRRLWGLPQTEQVSWSHNPTLHIAARVITWSTVALAVYDLIAPLLTSIIDGTATKPGLILLIELLMGLGLSIAGVFFLQAAAHEIGVRILTDQPARLSDLLEQQQAEYFARRDAIREQVRERYMQAKAAEKQVPFGSTAPEQAVPASIRMNGHGNGHGGESTAPSRN